MDLLPESRAKRGSTPWGPFPEQGASFFVVFLKKFLEDRCPFLGPLVPLFWISGDVSSGFQSQSGLPYSHSGGERNVRSPRSTSGATLADLSCSQNICEPDALPTELNRDRYNQNEGTSPSHEGTPDPSFISHIICPSQSDPQECEGIGS